MCKFRESPLNMHEKIRPPNMRKHSEMDAAADKLRPAISTRAMVLIQSVDQSVSDFVARSISENADRRELDPIPNDVSDR
jgi:hypothetical protein